MSDTGCTPVMQRRRRNTLPRGGQLAPGAIVGGKYLIERALGAGGMAIVVAATELVLRRPVALKALARPLVADEGAIKRFKREARALVRLQSEHVVRVFDVGELADGTPYMAMERLVGRDLDTVLSERGGRLPAREAVDLLLQAMLGLADAHAAGIIHRDLKPANLFVTRRSDGRPLVKLLDFGLAKTAEKLGESRLTSASAIMGTHHYMSPEQLRRSHDVGVATDIWALGVCLYQLITGVLPFEPRRKNYGLVDIANLIIAAKPRPPETFVPDVPPGVSAAVMRCLRRDPNERFADLAMLGEALEPYASGEHAGIGARLERMLEEQTLFTPWPSNVMRVPGRSSAPSTVSEITQPTQKMHRARRPVVPSFVFRFARRARARVVTLDVAHMWAALAEQKGQLLSVAGHARRAWRLVALMILVGLVLPVLLLAIAARARLIRSAHAAEQTDPPPIVAEPAQTLTPARPTPLARTGRAR